MHETDRENSFVLIGLLLPFYNGIYASEFAWIYICYVFNFISESAIVIAVLFSLFFVFYVQN